MTYKMRLYLTRMHQLDSHMCVAMNHTSQYRVIRDGFRIVSRLGDGLFWYVLMIGLFMFGGEASVKPVLHMCLAGLVGTVSYKWLKGKTLRPRPYAVHQDVFLTGTPLDKFSFPSGHTLHAVIFSLVAIHYYPMLAVVLIPFCIMIGFSRIILGLHYPSDVFAGAALGGVITWLSFLCV